MKDSERIIERNAKHLFAAHNPFYETQIMPRSKMLAGSVLRPLRHHPLASPGTRAHTGTRFDRAQFPRARILRKYRARRDKLLGIIRTP
jgi:hypothetical protein